MNLVKKSPLILLVIFCLTISPLIVRNGMYERPKVIVFLGLGFSLTFFYIIDLFKGKFFSLAKGDLFFLLWLGILLIASLIGIHPPNSILGGDYRHQGVLFFFTLWLVGKTISALPVQQKLMLKTLLIWSITVEIVYVSLDYFLNLSSWRIFGYKGPLGTLGEPNATAGFIIQGLFLVSGLSRIKKYFLIMIIGISFVFLRSLSVIIIYFEYLSFIFLKKYQQILLVLFLIMIIPVMLFAVEYQSKSIDIGQNLEKRWVIWKYSLEAISRRPLFGYGSESTTTVFKKILQEKKIFNTTLMIDRSHNLILDLLMWSGIFGTIAFLGWLLINIIGLLKRQAWMMIAGIIGWLTFASVQPLGIVHWLMLVYFIYL